jgi:hypothetical protein
MSLLLVAILATPAMAAQEQSVGASVSVGEYVSITLADGGTHSGLNFSANPDGTPYDDNDQTQTNPAMKVIVGSETNVNVDIGIKGSTSSALALDSWKYCDTYLGIKAGLTTSYVAVYTNATPGTFNFYHWVTVPAATPSGSYSATVYYKAVKTATGF